MEKEIVNPKGVEAADRVETLRGELEAIRSQHPEMIKGEIGYFLNSLQKKYPHAKQYRLFHLLSQTEPPPSLFK